MVGNDYGLKMGKSIKTVQEEIFPNEEQKLKIWRTIGCCRFVYNYMLSRNKKAYRRRKERVMSYVEMANLLPKLKRVYPWLAEANAQALQHSCRRLALAYRKFFREKHVGPPKFKSRKNSVQSYTTAGLTDRHVKKDTIRISSLGEVRWNPKREIRHVKTSPTVVCKNDRYYVSVTVEEEKDMKPVAVSDNGKVVGLDYKSDGLYADSNGQSCDMPHFYRKAQKRLRKLQRKLSHKLETHIIGYDVRHRPYYDKKLSECRNVEKQRKKVAKLYRHVAYQRKDFLHKRSTTIAKLYDVVCVESLNMKALANKGFGNGKATLDNGYGIFLTMLDYKLCDQGKYLVKVDKLFPSSQICSDCGHQNPSVKDLGVRRWVCPVCGEEHDRDVNSAINIRNEGLRKLLEELESVA